MSEDEWSLVCQKEQTIPLNAQDLCVHSIENGTSPIDDFLEHVRSIVVLGVRETLDSNPALGRVLLLGVISATEHYFRSVLARMIYVCPFCRKTASDHQIAFGAFDYYPQESMALGLMENSSFATEGELKKQCNRLLGLDISKDSSLNEALSNFEMLCHLRHAAVHARGGLNLRNARTLGVNGIPNGRLEIRVNFAEFQKSVAICTNVARAFNRVMYRFVLERWIKNGKLSGEWSDDKDAFSSLHQIFYSRKDSCGPSTAYNRYRKFLPVLRKRISSRSVAISP